MEKIIVSEEKSNVRIDKFLMQEFFLDMGLSRGEIIRNIKDGNVLVNEKNVKPSYFLKLGDEIRLEIKIKEKEIKSNKKVKFKIISVQDNFIVINKPAGLQVHPSNKNERDTLVNGLINKFPEIKDVGDDPKNRPGIVHRLDKNTSGIMIIVRNQKTFLELKEKFKNHEVQKTYWAIIYGKMENEKGVIEAPIARSSNYKKQVIASGKTKTKIREAITEYKVLKSNDKFSLVEVKPKTGRMHQIRIHFSSIGHPILGDLKYILKNIKPISEVKRHLLHAKEIEFSLFGQNFEFETELPKDFRDFIENNL